jgi:hypothetical protein
MSFSQYLAAREFLAFIGQPLITYILILSFLQVFFSVLYLVKKKAYSEYLVKCLYINTALYVLGFIFLIWFHIQIYTTVLIEYPAILRQMIPVENSRFVIPL